MIIMLANRLTSWPQTTHMIFELSLHVTDQ